MSESRMDFFEFIPNDIIAKEIYPRLISFEKNTDFGNKTYYIITGNAIRLGWTCKKMHELFRLANNQYYFHVKRYFGDISNYKPPVNLRINWIEVYKQSYEKIAEVLNQAQLTLYKRIAEKNIDEVQALFADPKNHLDHNTWFCKIDSTSKTKMIVWLAESHDQLLMNYCYQSIQPCYDDATAPTDESETIKKKSTPKESLLFYAVALRQPLETLRLLIRLHPESVNEINDGGNTPLAAAAYHGYEKVVAFLLENKANVDKNAYTCAASRGHADILRVLLSHHATLPDNEIFTLALLAAGKGHVAVVELLVKHGLDVNQTHAGYTLLSKAAEFGHLNVINALFESSANVEVDQKTGLTALQRAAIDGHDQVILVLLNKLANVHKQSDGGSLCTPLHFAAFHGNLTTAVILLENGANPNTLDKDGETPLHCAAKRNHLAMVRLLLAHGAPVNIRNTEYPYRTALHFAAQNNYSLLARELLKNKADPYQVNALVESPLHIAARLNYVNMVSVLLEYMDQKEALAFTSEKNLNILFHPPFAGVVSLSLLLEGVKKIHNETQLGLTPLLIAVAENNVDVIRVLIKNKVAVNGQRGLNTLRPLYAAAYKGHLEAVKCLVEEGGANLTLKFDGRTALETASRHGYRVVAAYLQKKFTEKVDQDKKEVRKAAILIAQGTRDRSHYFFQMPKEIKKFIAVSVAEVLPLEQAADIAEHHLTRRYGTKK